MDLIFLKPSEYFYKKIDDYLLEHGFTIEKEMNNNYRYVKEKAFLDVRLAEDWSGKYIVVDVCNIDLDILRKLLSVCPECGSNNIKPSLFRPWRNDITDQLFKEDRIDYGLAYSRVGTLPPTKRCRDCGCDWFNMADIRYWNDIVKSGRKITKEDLGIQ